MKPKEMGRFAKELIQKKLMIAVDGSKYQVGTDKKIYIFDDREENLSVVLEKKIEELKRYLGLNNQFVLNFTGLEKTLKWSEEDRYKYMVKQRKIYKIMAEKYLSKEAI